MDRLPPIPSPPGHLFREFMHRVVPLAAFVAATLTVGTLWNKRYTGTMLFGEVEPVHADIATVEAGTLTSICVERFQAVTNGQIIATVEILDTGSADRELDVLRTELRLMRSRMALDEARNSQSIEDVKVRWLDARVNLATAKVSLENAIHELRRVTNLREEKIASEAEYDTAKSVHDALEAEVRERTSLVDGLAGAVGRLEVIDQRDRAGSMQAIEQALAAQERKVEQGRTQVLRSPMDGLIKTVNHHAGERLASGTILTSVTALRSAHIVGFVRQPLSIDPQPGMPVEIRTRGPHRQTATSSIRSVGTDLELVQSPLRLRGFDNAVERGLAFFVDLPPDLDVHPGELVDLIVRPLESKDGN